MEFWVGIKVGVLTALVLLSQSTDHEEIQIIHLDWDVQVCGVWGIGGNPNSKYFWSLLCIMTLFYLEDKRERKRKTYELYLLINFFHDEENINFLSFPSMPFWLFPLDIYFFSTIAHMSWWMESEKFKEMSWGQKVRSEFGDALISGWEFGIFIWWKA